MILSTGHSFKIHMDKIYQVKYKNKLHTRYTKNLTIYKLINSNIKEQRLGEKKKENKGTGVPALLYLQIVCSFDFFLNWREKAS